MFRFACAGFGVMVLAGCAGSPSAPEHTEAEHAVSEVETEAEVSPYVGTWSLDRLSTWLMVWEMAYGKASEVGMPDEQYKEMSAKINEVVDSMSIEIVVSEDGSMSIAFEMGDQHDTSVGTWKPREDGSIDVLAHSAQAGETVAIGTIENGQFVLVTPADPSGFGTTKFNRVSK